MPLEHNHSADYRFGTFPYETDGSGIRRNFLTGSLFFLVSGIAGTIYLSLAHHGAYGILAFIQGPVVLRSKFPGSIASYSTEFLVLFTFFSSAISFFFFRPGASGNSEGFRYLRQYRLLSAFLVVAYAEVITVLALSIALGYTSNNSMPLSYGSGSAAENALYVLVYIFLLSFGVFTAGGAFMGIWGSVSYAYHLLRRPEFIAMWFFLFAGVFYFPSAILAGILGIYTVGSRESIFVRAGRKLYFYADAAFTKFLASRRAEWITLSASSAGTFLLALIASETVPATSNGTTVFYLSRYMNGQAGILISVLLATGAYFSSGSLLAIFRKVGRKAVYAGMAFFFGIIISMPVIYLLAFSYYSFVEQTRIMFMIAPLQPIDFGVLVSLAVFAGLKRKQKVTYGE